MLKIKEQLNYKRGGQSRNCSFCDFFIRKHPCKGLGGEDLGEQCRCEKIGLNAGRMYRVTPKHVCDAYSQERWMTRLMGDRAKPKGARHEAA